MRRSGSETSMNDSPFTENSPAVQAHLSILQNVIQRMSTNSSSAKGWCITSVSAILVLVANKGNRDYAFIALMPALLFFFLDAYYLSLEKRFRDSYNVFVRKLHGRELVVEDLYSVVPSDEARAALLGSLKSASVWPFYVTVLAMVVLAWLFVV